MKTIKPETPVAQGRAEAKGSASAGRPQHPASGDTSASVHVVGERSEGRRMPEAAAPLMEQDLRALEFRIDELIQTCDRLREENALLRDQQTSLLGQQTGLLAERARLIKKTEVVSSRVESMILRFKSMEYDA